MSPFVFYGGYTVKKKIKNVVLTALILILTAVLGTGCSKKEAKSAAAETTSDSGVSKKLQQLRKTGVLKVGSSGDFYAYTDQKTKEFSGLDAEIIKEVAKRLGIKKVEMELIPFSELILNLNSGNVDIICDGMYVRKARAKKVCFGDIWYTQGGGLLVPEDSPINSQKDFNPAKTTVGFTNGTAWQSVVEGWAKDGLIKQAVATGDQTESIVALQYGKIDAFLTDSPLIESLNFSAPDTLKGLKLCSSFEDNNKTLGHIAPAVQLKDAAFMKEVNDVVYQLREEGWLDTAFKKWGWDPALHNITNSDADRKWQPVD